MRYILIYIVVLCVITFLIFGIDKLLAIKNMHRISERTLLILCLIGGGIGGIFAMTFFRHKTSHMKFRILVPITVVLNIAGLYYFYKNNVTL